MTKYPVSIDFVACCKIFCVMPALNCAILYEVNILFNCVALVTYSTIVINNYSHVNIAKSYCEAKQE